MSMPAMSNSNAGCKPVKLAFKAEIEISAFLVTARLLLCKLRPPGLHLGGLDGTIEGTLARERREDVRHVNRYSVRQPTRCPKPESHLPALCGADGDFLRV